MNEEGSVGHQSKPEILHLNPHREWPAANPWRDAHTALDTAVLAAYGFNAKQDLPAELLALNRAVAARIERGESVTAPGVPPDLPNPDRLVTEDCIQPVSPG